MIDIENPRNENKIVEIIKSSRTRPCVHVIFCNEYDDLIMFHLSRKFHLPLYQF
jgi:hypothetical protein